MNYSLGLQCLKASIPLNDFDQVNPWTSCKAFPAQEICYPIHAQVLQLVVPKDRRQNEAAPAVRHGEGAEGCASALAV